MSFFAAFCIWWSKETVQAATLPPIWGLIWVRSFEAFLIIRTIPIVYFPIDLLFILFLSSFFALSFFKQFHNDCILHTIYF